MEDEEIKDTCDKLNNNYSNGNIITREEKVDILKYWADKYRDVKTFIETGTHDGYTLLALKDVFKELYSVELDKDRYLKSIERYAKENSPRNIEIVHASSLWFLPRILKEINTPCFFWLDAYDKERAPILSELEYIFNHNIRVFRRSKEMRMMSRCFIPL